LVAATPIDPPLPWLTAPLREVLGAARAHHALLIHGPAGVGQFEFALSLAQAWLCEGEAALRPCGRCASCLLIRARSHPDLRVLIPEALEESLGWSADEGDDAQADSSKGTPTKPSKEIKVDAVRSAIAFAQFTSARGRCKVVVIYPVDRMNTVAANALLKTLEEPPGTARFALATGMLQSLPPTVRSRCQPVHLSVPERDVAAQWLAAQGVDEPEIVLSVAGGQPFEALAWIRDGIDASTLANLPARVLAGDASALANWPLPRVVDALQKVCHDQLSTLAGARPRYFTSFPTARRASVGALHEWARSLARAARHAEHPLNAGLLTESLVLQGQCACAGIDQQRSFRVDDSIHSRP
jgi:DNA polymerase III subunit delta'